MSGSPSTPDPSPAAETAGPIDYAHGSYPLFSQERPSRHVPVLLICGGALAAVVVLFGMFGLLNLGGRVEAPQTKCLSNLHQIGLAILMYANDHGGRFPDSLDILLRDGYITSDAFVCPVSGDTPAKGPTTAAVVKNLTAGGHLSYIYVGKGFTTAAKDGTILAYEPLINHGGKGISVLYSDGHAEWQNSSLAGKIIAELQAGHNPPRLAPPTEPASNP